MKKFLTFLGVLLFAGTLLSAQTIRVTGTVTDQIDGLTLPGVTVLVKGTTQGTLTDLSGNYEMEVAPNATLVFSFVGMITQEIPVDGRNVINVSLGSELVGLDEVIVVGYSTTTRRTFTGSASTVTSERLASRNVGNISQALVGEVPGLTVINTSGQPGTVATLRVRGVGTVQGNASPLYVVDGVPYDGAINALNPNDIESVTVLTDASATAIYGARGANGVVVINTKRGQAHRPNIQVEYRQGVNTSFLPRYDRIKDPEEYIGLAWEGLYNRGRALGNADPVAYANNAILGSQLGIGGNAAGKYNMWNVTNGSELIDPDTRTVRPGVTRRYDPEDWEDYAFQSSIRSEANLSFSGGTDRTTYFMSLGYLNDVGYSINSYMDRLSGRLNVTHRIADWLDGSMNMGYTLYDINASGQSSDSGSIFWFVDNIPSIYPLFLRDAEGNKMEDPFQQSEYIYDYGTGRRFGALTNSIADAHIGKRGDKNQNMNFNTNLRAHILPGLTLENTLSSSFRNMNRHIQNSPFYGPANAAGGSIYRRVDEYFSYNFLNLLRYRTNYDLHNLEVFAAHEANLSDFWIMTAYKNKLANPNGIELDNAVVSSPSTSRLDRATLESYFGQVNYDFNNKYFLSGTVRHDGSSRFINNKWGTFGSVGAAWLLSEEDFLSGNDLVRMLKLKTSYGVLGEQGGIGLFTGYDLYNVDNVSDEYAFRFSTKGNPDLTWERSKMFQVGVEFTLGNFLNGSVEFYNKVTDDLLFEKRIPPSQGYAILLVNDGELLNRGLVFDLNSDILRTSDGYLNFRVNGEFLHNELRRMPLEPDGTEKILDIAGAFGRTAGRSLFDFYMRDFLHVDPDDGRPVWRRYYVMENGQEVNIVSLHQFEQENPDRVDQIVEGETKTYADATNMFIGKSAFPKLRGGFSLDGKYKAFDVSVRLLYSLGGYGYDFTYAQLMRNDLPGGNNWHKDIHDAWKQPGDVTDVPRISADYDKNYNSTQSRFLTSSSYLSLNNVRIGYTLPGNITRNIFLQGLNLSVSADNLWLLTARKGYNPTTAYAGGSDWYTYNPLTTFSFTARVNL